MKIKFMSFQILFEVALEDYARKLGLSNVEVEASTSNDVTVISSFLLRKEVGKAASNTEIICSICKKTKSVSLDRKPPAKVNDTNKENANKSLLFQYIQVAEMEEENLKLKAELESYRKFLPASSKDRIPK